MADLRIGRVAGFSKSFTYAAVALCSHECEHGTHECVRHGGLRYSSGRIMQLRMIWALAVLVLCADGLQAGQPMLRMFTTEDGLARNWVKRIRRDHSGRLWFCTVEGLSVFDGERFTNYTLADGLPNRYVSDFLDAGDAGYFIIMPAGLYHFRPRGGAGRASAPIFTKVALEGVEDPTDY